MSTPATRTARRTAWRPDSSAPSPARSPATRSASATRPDYGHRLEFATFPEPLHDLATSAVEPAVLSERWGYNPVLVQDHPYRPRYLDRWTLMTWMAARTERIGVGSGVLNGHNPPHQGIVP